MRLKRRGRGDQMALGADAGRLRRAEARRDGGPARRQRGGGAEERRSLVQLLRAQRLELRRQRRVLVCPANKMSDSDNQFLMFLETRFRKKLAHNVPSETLYLV